MISFRLTSDEYDKCRELCFDRGVRSVSEMARAGINLLLQQPDRMPEEALEARVAELEGRLRMLALELKKLKPNAAAAAASALSPASPPPLATD
jgi:hypothetical protein